MRIALILLAMSLANLRTLSASLSHGSMPHLRSNITASTSSIWMTATKVATAIATALMLETWLRAIVTDAVADAKNARALLRAALPHLQARPPALLPRQRRLAAHRASADPRTTIAS